MKNYKEKHTQRYGKNFSKKSCKAYLIRKQDKRESKQYIREYLY